MKLIVFGFLLINIISNVNSLRCYTCTVTENDIDQRCADTPELVEAGSPITNCNKKYCTSQRNEYLDPKGKIQSVFRTCQDEPDHLNEVVEDGTLRIYYRACGKDLCNGGTGKDTSVIETQNGKQGKGILYVPGIGESAAEIVLPNVLMIIIPVILKNL